MEKNDSVFQEGAEIRNIKENVSIAFNEIGTSQ